MTVHLVLADVCAFEQTVNQEFLVYQDSKLTDVLNLLISSYLTVHGHTNDDFWKAHANL